MDNYLTLAYRNLESVSNSYVISHGQTVKHLDLSYNKLTDKSLMAIGKFEKLESLVLDGNQITSQVEFPILQSLHTLSVNKNKVTDLATFIAKLVCVFDIFI
jgi:Leucine-rich repeat (LRR) protein